MTSAHPAAPAAGLLARRRAALRGDEGSAIVEFLLVTILVLILFTGVLQVGLMLHVKHTLTASAAEGARYAANADRSLADGEAHTRRLVAAALSERLATEIEAGREYVGDVPTVVVRVRARVPVLGVLPVGGTVEVAGHAFDEETL